MVFVTAGDDRNGKDEYSDDEGIGHIKHVLCFLALPSLRGLPSLLRPVDCTGSERSRAICGLLTLTY